jgi:transcriptional regulator with XRE-family HTH domain
MTRLELVQKVKSRKETLGITIENLAKLSHNGARTVNRFLSGEDVKLSTVESITNVLGLDFAGNKTISLDKLKKQRATQKAIFMASLVQGTSALEMQGLEEDSLNRMIDKFKEEFLTGSYQNRLWVA